MNVEQLLKAKLSKQTLKELSCQNSCPFWTILSKCESGEKCNYGNHNKQISTMVHKNNFNEAIQLCKWFQHVLTQSSKCGDNIVNVNQRERVPLLAGIYEYLADILIIHTNYDMADYYFDKANIIYPQNHSCLLKQAQMLTQFKLENCQSKTHDLYQKLINLTPNDKDCNFSFGLSLRDNFNLCIDSLFYFAKCVELQPSNPQYNYEYGLTLYQCGFKYYDQALSTFEKTLDIRNKNCNISDNNNNNNGNDLDCHDHDNGGNEKNQFENIGMLCKQMISDINNIKNWINDTNRVDVFSNNNNNNNNNKQIRINHFAQKLRRWIETESYNRPIRDDIAVAYVNDDDKISSKERQNMIHAMIKEGYDDVTLIDFKLKIYNYNLKNVQKYFENDRFCHHLCLFGHCLSGNECKYTHCFSLGQLLNDSIHRVSIITIKQALLLSNYLLYVYKNDNELQNNDVDHYCRIMASINDALGDIYRIIAHNKQDFIKADEYYDRARYFWFGHSERNLTHAKMLDECVYNWQKAEMMFEYAIQTANIDNKAYEHFSYGFSLRCKGFFDRAVVQFEEAIKYKGDNPKYYFELAETVFKKGYNYDKQTVELFEHVLKIADYTSGFDDKLINKANNRLQQIQSRASRLLTHCHNHNHNQRNSIMFDDEKKTNIVAVGVETVDNNNDKFTIRSENNPDLEQRDMFRIMFWNQLNWDGCDIDIDHNDASRFDKYLNKFCELKYDYLSFLPFINEKVLCDEIGMSKKDCQYFLKQIFKWNCQCKKFVYWLKHNDLYDLYFTQLNLFGIYTLESLKYFIKKYSNDWHCKVLKNKHTKDCFQLDSKLIVGLVGKF